MVLIIKNRLLTDTHCHIDFEYFDDDRDTLLQHCYQVGIHRMIIPAIAPSNWQKVLTLTNKVDNANTPLSSPTKTCQLFAALGIHPWFLHDLNESALMQLTDVVATHSQHLAAIGETGIDLVIAEKYKNLTQQIMFFEHQLSLSNQYNLPIIIHHRRSHELTIDLLKKYKINAGGVIHAFSGSYQQAKTYIDLGFKLGVGGTITYDRAKKTISAIKKLPLESLLLETDAPSMPLQGFQGEHNSPLRLINILNALHTIRPENIDVLAQSLENNVSTLFFKRNPKTLTTKTV